jgi:DNA-binding beta-propeller fold protein YncE
MRLPLPCALTLAICGCSSHTPPPYQPPMQPGPAALPLELVADAPLPGRANRFDYQELDAKRNQLVVAHMNANSVLVLDLASGAVRAELPNIPTPRGIAVSAEEGLVFVTSTPSQLVVIDAVALTEVRRVPTGTAPDGDAWDPVDRIVGVSDQGDGALSLIANAGAGARVQVPLGTETGNVVYDAARGRFWITVVRSVAPDRVVSVDPVAGTVDAQIDLPGCEGAHGLRLHPDGQSAIIACEGNDTVARVGLAGSHEIATAASGAGPDVLAIDPSLGWVYVAAESGDLVVFDLAQPGLVAVGHDQPGDRSHSVAVDAATHRVFFPLEQGPSGTPVMRIMRPSGT